MSHMYSRPLTASNWEDFEKLFGTRGAYGGCWCMWWRLTRKEFERNQGEGNKQAMRVLVDAGNITGILLYKDGEPAAWCSVAPREEYATLERSRLLKRRDDQPTWAIVCLFVDRKFRRQGLCHRLIEAAIDHVRQHGGLRIEAYPTIVQSEKVPPVSSFMGFPALFARAGFREVARVSDSRMIMEYRF